MKSLEGKAYEEQLRIDLFSVEKKRLRSDVITVCSFRLRSSSERSAGLFSLVIGCGGNGLKLHQGRLRLDIRKAFC